MSRIDLHNRLKALLVSDNVSLYFQPPANIKMTYPCLVYDMNDIDTSYADGAPYMNYIIYQVMLITKQPDEEITAKIMKNVPLTRFDRSYISDNLYHYVFTCYEKMI